MNEIVNKFLLAGDKFMSEMHLKQLGFTYSACGPFAKNKERIRKFMQTGNGDYIYQNDLDKAFSKLDMAYGKYLTKSTQADKLLRDKGFKIGSNPKYDGYQRGLASMMKTQNAVKLNLCQINNSHMNFVNQLLKYPK